jgi:hypothetical protein
VLNSKYLEQANFGSLHRGVRVPWGQPMIDPANVRSLIFCSEEEGGVDDGGGGDGDGGGK